MSTTPAVLDQPSTTARVWSTLSAPPGPAASGLCWLGSLLLLVSAFIHLHLWDTGYRHIPTIGPLFLLQGIAGIVIAVVIAVWRRPLVSLIGALFAASTIGGLVLSVEVGLFGFKDSFSAPYATSSLIIEAAAFVVLAVATFVSLHRGVESGHEPAAALDT